MRSFIFQVLLLAWTALMFLWAVAGVAATSDYRGPYRDAHETGQAMGMLCTFFFWIIIALPLAIAAIATFEGGKKNLR